MRIKNYLRTENFSLSFEFHHNLKIFTARLKISMCSAINTCLKNAFTIALPKQQIHHHKLLQTTHDGDSKCVIKYGCNEENCLRLSGK